MKRDIRNKDDIKLMVDAFYEKVRRDQQIGYLFNEVAKVNWEHHLPRMYDFWDAVIFQTGNFSGNPMIAHIRLHNQSPLSEEHFNRWKQLFFETVDELFEGKNAALAKERANSIAAVMQLKVLAPGPFH